MSKVTFKIADMHCSNCVMRLESLEDELPGVRQVTASYHTHKMDVEFDEEQTSLEKIADAIRKKGYQPIL